MLVCRYIAKCSIAYVNMQENLLVLNINIYVYDPTRPDVHSTVLSMKTPQRNNAPWKTLTVITQELKQILTEIISRGNQLTIINHRNNCQKLLWRRSDENNNPLTPKTGSQINKRTHNHHAIRASRGWRAPLNHKIAVRTQR